MRTPLFALLLLLGCHSTLLDAPRAYPCAPTGEAEACPEDWRCGLDGFCHARGVPAPYVCAGLGQDEACEAGWRCGPEGRCVDATAEQLPPSPPAEALLATALPRPDATAGLPAGFSYDTALLPGTEVPLWQLAYATEGALVQVTVLPQATALPAGWARAGRKVSAVAVHPPSLLSVGRHTFFLTPEGLFRLSVLAGEAPVPLSSAFRAPGELRVSPDGRYLVAFRADAYALFALAPDGTLSPLPSPALEVAAALRDVEGVADAFGKGAALVLATDVGLASARYGTEGFLADDGSASEGPVWHWVDSRGADLALPSTCPAREGPTVRTPRRLHRGERVDELWVEADDSLSGAVQVAQLSFSALAFRGECLEQGLFYSSLQGSFCAACPDGSAPLHVSGSTLPRTRCALPEGGAAAWASVQRQATACTLALETPQLLPGREALPLEARAEPPRPAASRLLRDAYVSASAGPVLVPASNGATTRLALGTAPRTLSGDGVGGWLAVSWPTGVPLPQPYASTPAQGFVPLQGLSPPPCEGLRGQPAWAAVALSTDVASVPLLQDVSPVLTGVGPPRTLARLARADTAQLGLSAWEACSGPDGRALTVAAAGKSRTGRPAWVAAVGERVWGEELPEALPAAGMVAEPRLVPLPGGRVTALALEEVPEDAPHLLAGWALASERLFRLRAETAVRWYAEELLLPGPSPRDVWTDGTAGRVGLADGSVLSLPGRVPLAGALPAGEGPVVQYAQACGQVYALGPRALFRLVTEEGTGAVGTWQPLALPALAEGLFGARLHAAGDTLLVVSASGGAVTVRDSACAR